MTAKLSSEPELGGGVGAVAVSPAPAAHPFTPWLPVDRRPASVPLSYAARLAVFAAGLAVLYAVGALLPFWYLSSPEAGAAFFPPAGLTFAALLLTPRRTWPLWLSVVAVTEVVIDLTHGQGVALALGFALANVCEPAVGASLVRRFLDRGERLIRSRLVALVACGVIAGPVVGATIGATTSVVFSNATGFFTIAGKWWIGDALGVLVVASPILAWALPLPFDARPSPRVLALIVGVASGILLVPALIWHHPMVWAVLPVLGWAAFAGGVRAVTVAGVGVAFAADWAAITGRADQLLAAGSPGKQLIYVQAFLGLTLLTGLTLAMEIAERRRSEQAVRDADAERIAGELRTVEIAEAERHSIARETHDIVGHGLNVMLLQAGAVRRVIDRDPALAKELLDALESTGRSACRELDVALAMSVPSPNAEREHGLASLGGVVGILRASGLRVHLNVDGDTDALPTLVDWSAYRIVQEALTNVAKHAPGASVTIDIAVGPDDVKLAVVDDGAGVKAENVLRANGRGLIGIRERVAALGGSIDVGPNGTRGFAVRAALPLKHATM